MKKLFFLLTVGLLTSCGGSSNSDKENLVVNGVRSDGSCSPELVNLYNQFSGTYEMVGFPESQVHTYRQNIQRDELCQRIKVNVDKGTTCAVQNGNLDFTSLKSACSYAAEVKAAKTCDKDFMKVYVYLKTLKHNTEVLRLINFENAFKDRIIENINSMKSICKKIEQINFKPICLNENYSKTISGQGPILGYARQPLN